MNVEVSEIGPCRRQVVIDVDKDVIEERVRADVREFKKSRPIPGFRPGKTPDSVIRRRFGKQIRAGVLRDLIPEVWESALRDNELIPLSQPEMEPIDDETEGALKISGTVDIRPQVELGDFDKLVATRRVRPVMDEDVERRLDIMRQQRAVETTVERPAQNGDVVVATLQKVDEAGIVIIGEEEDERRWELAGLGSMSPELDEGVVGMEVGENRVVAYHYRDDFYDKNRAGQDDRSRVTLKEVIERDVPELDEEFVKDVGDYETVSDLQEAVRADMEANLRAASSSEVYTQIREQIGGLYDFDVPDSLVERMIHGMFHEHERAQANDDEHEHGEDEPDHNSEEHEAALEAFTTENRDEAIRRVRAMLALDMIGDQANLQIEEEHVRQRIAMMAAQYQTSPDQMAQYLVNSGRMGSVQAEMRDQLVLQFLEEKASIEEVEISEDEEE